LGSARVSGNTAGLFAWVLASLPSDHPLRAAVNGGAHPAPELFLMSPPNGPLGPVIDGERMPSTQADRTAPTYASAAVNEWSALVRSCGALLILTPQFNWGIPGEL
jgi:hypothetical protein